MTTRSADWPPLRIGQGFDVHRFGREATHVRIGGVDVPHTHALEAHSDGDVLLHAVTDAVLGAAGLGDIGQHFPDTDPAWADADSAVLLQRVMQRVAYLGWGVVNADATVIAQRPRLAPWVPAMQEATAGAMGVDPALVSIKATTSERLGFTGREEGIAALAVVLLARD